MEKKLSDVFKGIYENYYAKYENIFTDVISDIKNILGLIFDDFNPNILITTNEPVKYIRTIVSNLFNKLDVFIKDMESKSVNDYKDINNFFSDIFNTNLINTKKSKFIIELTTKYSAIKLLFEKLDLEIILPFIQVAILYCKAILKCISIIYDQVNSYYENKITINSDSVKNIFNRKYNNSVDIYLSNDTQVCENLNNIHFIENLNTILEDKNFVKDIKKIEMYYVNVYMNVISKYVNKNYRSTAKTLLNKICFPDAFNYDYGKQILLFYKNSNYSLTYELLNPKFIELLITIMIFLKKVDAELTINRID